MKLCDKMLSNDFCLIKSKRDKESRNDQRNRSEHLRHSAGDITIVLITQTAEIWLLSLILLKTSRVIGLMNQSAASACD